MIAQCKGKDLLKVPASKLLQNGWIASTKFDGHYVQIHKLADTVKFFTSGGKEFYIPTIANELLELEESNFILECEYIGKSLGKLGDRTKVGKLTTYRTMFEKGEVCDVAEDEKFIAFDIIIPDTCYIDRLELLNSLRLGRFIRKATTKLPMPLESCIAFAKDEVAAGYEGVYIKHRTHLQEAGKRVNTAIKLKYRPTADLLCIDVIAGVGKYSEMIGALVLQDSEGRIVSVGSGLSDNDRAMSPDWFLGKIIEIEYEQILDTYIQPTYIRIREDKEKED